MTLRLDRNEVVRLAIACTTLQQALEREAADAATAADRRTIAQSSAAAWGRLHDEIRAQLDDWDRKQAERAERGRRV